MAVLSAQNVIYIISAILKLRNLRPGEVKSLMEGHGVPDLRVSNSKACGSSRPILATRTRARL